MSWLRDFAIRRSMGYWNRVPTAFLNCEWRRMILLFWRHVTPLDNSNRHLNTFRPSQNGRHFPDDVFKCIFLCENVWISIEISLQCAPKVRINTINTRQAIIWTNACKFTNAYLRHSASMISLYGLWEMWQQLYYYFLNSSCRIVTWTLRIKWFSCEYN